MATITLIDEIVDRRPLGRRGASSNQLDVVRLRDGRELVLKCVSPDWDWISRATNDRGRAAWMWRAGVFHRMPAAIDHATVAIKSNGRSWSIFMVDVSKTLVRGEHKLSRVRVRRLLAALAQLHATFWEEEFPDLCSLEDRYRMLSFETARREGQLGNPVADMITRSWDAFSQLVPKEIAEAVFKIVEQPALLAQQLARCSQTLIHGDVRVDNLGFRGDRVVMLDWGDRTGTAPPAVELASFLIFDGLHLAVSREHVIAEFRQRYGDRYQERALQLALIGGFVQLGANFGLRILNAADEQTRLAARADLAWWTQTVLSVFRGRGSSS